MSKFSKRQRKKIKRRATGGFWKKRTVTIGRTAKLGKVCAKKSAVIDRLLKEFDERD